MDEPLNPAGCHPFYPQPGVQEQLHEGSGLKRRVGVGQGCPTGALGAGPLRPGPGWLGTKARECGLGRPAEPPGVSHLYFRGLGNHWLSPAASPGLGPSPLPGQPRSPAAAGKASPLGLPAPPLQPTCPLPARSSGPLSSGSSEQGLGVRTLSLWAQLGLWAWHFGPQFPHL